jgi:reactive intermediate/imine deaminase
VHFYHSRESDTREGESVNRTSINPAGVAAPAGNYSQVVCVDVAGARLIFVSGQVAVDEAGNVVGRDDMGAQAERVFENLRLVLEGAGASLADVVKATVFVTDMGQRGTVAEVRNRYFTGDPPASTFVEVSKLASPDWMIEIEVIAVAGGQTS